MAISYVLALDRRTTEDSPLNRASSESTPRPPWPEIPEGRMSSLHIPLYLYHLPVGGQCKDWLDKGSRICDLVYQVVFLFQSRGAVLTLSSFYTHFLPARCSRVPNPRRYPSCPVIRTLLRLIADDLPCSLQYLVDDFILSCSQHNGIYPTKQPPRT